MSVRKDFNKNNKADEAEIIRVKKPLKPWDGSVRDYNPNLSFDFKKRQKLKGRDKILLIVQKQIAENDGSETVEYTLELPSKSKEKEGKKTAELLKTIEKQKAVKKSLQEILAKEHKQNKSLEKSIFQKKQQWSLEKENFEEENQKLKNVIVALESQLQILNQRIKDNTTRYKSKIKDTEGQVESEKKSIAALQQDILLEKKRRKSLHSILDENAKESKEGIEKFIETNREREILIKKVNTLEKEKNSWLEDKKKLEENIQQLEEQISLLESTLDSKKLLESDYQTAKEQVISLKNEKLELQKRIDQYAEIAKNKLVEGEEVFGSRGRYKIIKKFKQGGMGDLYLAQRAESEEIVVVKTLQFTEEGDENKKILRFIQEARFMLSFQHPNLVTGLDYYQTPDKIFLVMEYLDGTTLEDFSNEKIVPEKDAAKIVLQVARALNYLSTLGIVHRDVKPANIIVDQDLTAKLMDFGILKTIHNKCFLTTSGIIMGTPYYLSPEQVTESYIDSKSDIYSLGITFYQLVTGKVPFQGENQVEVIAKRLTKNPPRASKDNSSLDKNIANLIEKMMDRKPAKRPTPLEVIEELESFLGITVN